MQETLGTSERRRTLLANAVVYTVTATSLFRVSNGREILRCLAVGLGMTRARTALRLAVRPYI